MRVLLDTTPAHPTRGTQVYADRLAAALRVEGIDVVVAANSRRRSPGTGSRRNLAEDLRWGQLDLRRRAREVDLVHHVLPSHTFRARVPQVVTVHDLAFEALPEAFDPRWRRFARVAHRLAALRAARVVVPSAATAAELEQRWGVRAIVAPHGPGQNLPRVPRPPEGRHFLYVGDAEPRKDLPTLLAAHARYRATATDPLPLVLAGRASSVDSGVRTERDPSPRRLAELLAQAAALVHPARHEGFGMTVLEALAAGTPVIAADIPAVREVAGDTARYVPAGDADALAAALHAPPPATGALRTRADAFSWRRSALLHIEAYRLAVDS